jgi:hypothetical protein
MHFDELNVFLCDTAECSGMKSVHYQTFHTLPPQVSSQHHDISDSLGQLRYTSKLVVLADNFQNCLINKWNEPRGGGGFAAARATLHVTSITAATHSDLTRNRHSLSSATPMWYRESTPWNVEQWGRDLMFDWDDGNSIRGIDRGVHDLLLRRLEERLNSWKRNYPADHVPDDRDWAGGLTCGVTPWWCRWEEIWVVGRGWSSRSLRKNWVWLLQIVKNAKNTEQWHISQKLSASQVCL